MCNLHKMVAHYIKALLSSFDFEGRMDRRAFWYFMLATTMVSLLAFASDATPIIDALTAGTPLLSLDKFGGAGKMVTMIHAVPILSANMRRLRDTGRTIGSMLFIFVPVVGQVALFAWLLEPSKSGALGTDHRQKEPKGKTSNWSDHVLR